MLPFPIKSFGILLSLNYFTAAEHAIYPDPVWQYALEKSYILGLTRHKIIGLKLG